MSNIQSTPNVSFSDRRRTAPDSQGAGDISPWELLRGIWARKELIGIAFVAFMALALVWMATVTPTYTVESRILLSTRTGEVSSFDASTAPTQPDSETVQSEMQVLTSRALIARLIADLKLADDPEFNPSLRRGFMGRFAALLGRRPGVPDEDVMIDRVLGRLNVYQKGTSRVVAIEFTSSGARMAALLANRLAELYIARQIEQKNNLNREATKWLAQQIEDLRGKVQSSEAAVEAFRSESGLFLTNGSTVPQQQLTDLNAQLSVAEADRAETEARLGNARSLVADGNSVNSAAAVLQSPLIQSLRGQEVALRAQIAQMTETYLPSHPKMIEAQANLADLNRQIGKEVDKIIQGLANDARVSAARVASLRASLTRLQSRMGALNQDEVQLRALERDAATNRSLLESFLKRFEEANARAEADARTANANIVSRAQELSEPTFPKKGAVLTLAIVAGLFLALIVSVFAEVFSRGFRTAEQVERITGTPFLGLVPELESRVPGGPAADVLRDSLGIYAEAIRGLQGSVMLARVGNRRARTVLITSAVKDEGKTATAASLARVLAMGGYRTILVDADMRSPSVHLTLGLPEQAGLSELLTGRAAFGHVIRQDFGSYAHIMQAGGILPNPTAALASSQMQWVLKALDQTYDFIIIDSPPVMAAADAQVLTKMTDVTVLVTRWSSTSRRVVTRVLKTLSAASGRRVGILLTRVNLRRYRRYTDSVIEEYPARPGRAA
ncbi:MAG: polysaccharide biosynthesis tyrosine autokinase [Parvibaculum sp.]|uniref:GumC family protein n=1 Tax=Parvibaculum sp. TaxID=2024848 RepID=UPI0025DE8096|nr:polysaccharide biosynthesis tyrosine autokinase [Parvibaculum sp.]MCE9649352.1 polysaccharide biosynthesis tyrosine autokinase [Parvibaculum sp.]